MRSGVGFLLAVTIFSACSHDQGTPLPDGGVTSHGALTSIAVTPAGESLLIDGTTPATGQFQAQGTFADGHTEDITHQATFSLSDLSLGQFKGNTLTSTTTHGGATSVLAAVGNVVGLTTLTLQIHEAANDPASANLPSNPAAKFSGANDPGRAPSLIYPNDGVLVPPNLGQLEFQFYPGANNTLFELSFSSTTSQIKIYLRCTPLNGGCVFEPWPALWTWLAESNRGASVTIGLRGTDDNGTGVGSAATQTLALSTDDVQGAIYYWTTSNGTGIMRYDFAGQSSPSGMGAAQKFVGPEVAGGECVGCHALSKDGTKMVAEAGGQNSGAIVLLDVASAMPIVPFDSTPRSTFESWEPSGDRFVGVYGDEGASDYDLLLFDGGTAQLLGAIDGTGSAAHPADHPDWSTDGNIIAYTKVGRPNTLQRMSSGAIEIVTQTGGGWSAPTEIAPSVAGKNRYYPAVSPDGSFLLFDESTCSPGGDGSECDADTDPTATLFAAPLRGGATPILLARANAPGPGDGGETRLTSSFPKWSPFIFRRTGEAGSRLEWVTFSSTRSFGLRHPPPPSDGSEGLSSTWIWMAAIDPDQVANGMDPSYPAFAVPFQDFTTSNHIAQWTTVVVPPIQ